MPRLFTLPQWVFLATSHYRHLLRQLIQLPGLAIDANGSSSTGAASDRPECGDETLFVNMPEIISIDSSPPGSPLRLLPDPTSREPRALDSLSIFNEDFDLTGDLDLAIDLPAKRRKLDSSDGTNISTYTVEPSHSGIDLSSDIEGSPKPKTFLRTQSAVCPSRVLEDVDDIMFSSSAPGLRKKGSHKVEPVVYALSSDSVLDDMIANEEEAEGQFWKCHAFSERTANLVANMSRGSSENLKGKQKATTGIKSGSNDLRQGQKRASVSGKSAVGFDDIVVSSTLKRNPKTRKTRYENSADGEVVNAQSKAGKELQKALEKERKQLERDRKAVEKQKAADLAEANRSRVTKEKAVVEIIVEMAGELDGKSIGTIVSEKVKELGAEVEFQSEELSLADDGIRYEDIGSLVQWKRKVAAEYEAEHNQWVPLNKTVIKYEDHILVHLTADQFATIAIGDPSNSASAAVTYETMMSNLDGHVARQRSRRKDIRLVYLIQGLQACLKKGQSVKNREHTAAVRALSGQNNEGTSATTAPIASQSKRKRLQKPSLPQVDMSSITDEIIEDLLLHLQLNHQPIAVQHSTSAPDTALHIIAFTLQLSTRPYRLAQLQNNIKYASFCTDKGQVRSGDDPTATWINMLQEVQRVTVSMAYGISAEYSTVQALAKGFEEDGRMMLENVRKSANKDGDWTDKRLGPQVSKRLYKVFMGKDPTATDGIA